MLLESDLIPYSVSLPAGNRSIVLAPHPDDETLGCGGTIRLLMESKKQVKVVFLTSGDKADPSHQASKIIHHETHVTNYSLMREKEAVGALKVLGTPDYEFLRFPDRELNSHYNSVLDRLSEVTKIYAPDTIYSPSMIELNPDHRTTAALAMEIQRINKGRIMFYEITTPLRPNTLVEVTSIFGIKKRAIKKYKSQLKLMDYLRHITALNTMRALSVQNARYVEAFWRVDEPLSGEGVRKWLCYLI